MTNKFTGLLAGLTITFAAILSSGTTAYAGPNTRPTQQIAAVTPLGMQYFCAQHRSECSAGGAAQVTMTQNLIGALRQVNSTVNRAIRPRRDSADIWQLNPRSGDCEDYVLSKRSALIHQGVPSGSLRIAYTHTRGGTPHAVLIVRTTEGDYVLDNLNNSVKTLRASGYRIRTMSTANPKRWTAV
ncbi:transglutaminase-like cysteine peptidase [uncultured Devosia sp.]|uniref:transglutaminase-like cysteine peptidase n=1 Tax=uncultured Devosia sp. TaxID=211434 RepID=UPI0035C9A14C